MHVRRTGERERERERGRRTIQLLTFHNQITIMHVIALFLSSFL